jgi:hypothetical protein
MKANIKYQNLPKDFWANIRSISQSIGYTKRKANQIRIPTTEEIISSFQKKSLSSKHLFRSDKSNTELGEKVLDYFKFRAEILNNFVEPRLMNATTAKQHFEDLMKKYNPTCPIPMNKQKGDKRAPAYFTATINILIQVNSKNYPCDYNPRELTTITRNGRPLRTLARWVDGAFPTAINPIAIWEIKEYYYTTTFGSRVADGVYESLLDGMELAELYEHEKIKIQHYLMVDDHNTWWNDGKSYLCRLVDMLHMGYVDEILFGSEVFERLPLIVEEWTSCFNS